MEILVKKGRIVDVAADAIVVNLFQGAPAPGSATAAVDQALGGAISDLIAAGDLCGKAGEATVVYTRGALPAPRVIVVGLGDPAKFTVQTARTAAASAARRARDLGLRKFATVAHGAGQGNLTPLAAGQALAEGTLLGLYRFQGYRSQPPKEWKSDPETMIIVEPDVERLAALPIGVARAEAVVKSVRMARDMVNEPANHLTPGEVAARAADLAADTGLACRVLDQAEMERLGMSILLAVAQASIEEPKLVVLEHNAGREDLPTVVIIGKGVTFDSGGISLKPHEEMWRMKDDMAGAAAVIGAMGIAARCKFPLHVVGLAPLAENLPGGNAQKPSDVFRGMSGKTMEVISTDAEGRMLLADALAYAAHFHPAAVVDIATLTGAQEIALGPQAAAVFSNSDEVAAKLLAAADASGERLWRMPLYDEYADAIKSQVADVKNSGGRTSGIGTSAKFLEHFTEGYPWAHIDMASMAWSEEDRPARPKGATGYGVRLLATFLENWGA